MWMTQIHHRFMRGTITIRLDKAMLGRKDMKGGRRTNPMLCAVAVEECQEGTVRT